MIRWFIKPTCTQVHKADTKLITELSLLLKECEKTLEKVCRRNDIPEAVLDYYGDCSMMLAKLREGRE